MQKISYKLVTMTKSKVTLNRRQMNMINCSANDFGFINDARVRRTTGAKSSGNRRSAVQPPLPERPMTKEPLGGG